MDDLVLLFPQVYRLSLSQRAKSQVSLSVLGKKDAISPCLWTPRLDWAKILPQEMQYTDAPGLIPDVRHKLHQLWDYFTSCDIHISFRSFSHTARIIFCHKAGSYIRMVCVISFIFTKNIQNLRNLVCTVYCVGVSVYSITRTLMILLNFWQNSISLWCLRYYYWCFTTG